MTISAAQKSPQYCVYYAPQPTNPRRKRKIDALNGSPSPTFSCQINFASSTERELAVLALASSKFRILKSQLVPLSKEPIVSVKFSRERYAEAEVVVGKLKSEGFTSIKLDPTTLTVRFFYSLEQIEVMCKSIGLAFPCSPEDFVVNDRECSRFLLEAEQFHMREISTMHPRTFSHLQSTKQFFLDNPKSNYTAIFSACFQRASGICLGEAHRTTDANKLLMDNMSELVKKLELRTIFIEGLTYELFNPLLTSYFEQRDKEMPKKLEKFISRFDVKWGHEKSSYSLLNLVRAAKVAGIRVLGIETELSRLVSLVSGQKAQQNPMQETITTYLTKRHTVMNFVATKIINEHQQVSPSKKFVVIVGPAHVYTYNKKLLSLSHLLRCPGVNFEDYSARMSSWEEEITTPHKLLRVNNLYVYLPE